MRYASQALPRRRLLWAVLALGIVLLCWGCADHAKPHVELGLIFQKQGKTEEAIVEFREAIRLKPDFAEAHFNLGVALGQKGEREEAIKEYREAIRLNPNYAEAHFHLGISLGVQRKFEEQIDEIQKAVQLKPEDSNWLEILGMMLDVRGRRKEARVYWERALKSEDKPEWIERIKKRLAEPD